MYGSQNSYSFIMQHVCMHSYISLDQSKYYYQIQYTVYDRTGRSDKLYWRGQKAPETRLDFQTT